MGRNVRHMIQIEYVCCISAAYLTLHWSYDDPLEQICPHTSLTPRPHMVRSRKGGAEFPMQFIIRSQQSEIRAEMTHVHFIWITSSQLRNWMNLGAKMESNPRMDHPECYDGKLLHACIVIRDLWSFTKWQITTWCCPKALHLSTRYWTHELPLV